jgi:iron complex outermembrane receptor protein
MRATKSRLAEVRAYRTLAFAIAVALSTSSAWAQDSGAAAKDKDDAKAKEPATLGTVTVTAERRRENVQKVPVSISTLGGAELHSLGNAGDDVRALSARVPSLVIESSFGRTFPRFYIRGLGNTDFDLNASQPVSLIYDDVVLENPILKGFPIFDIDQVEVLRGPQGTLFGRNTPAGVVKFQSVQPSQDVNGYMTASYGTYGTFNAEGAVGGALSDSVSARGSVLYQTRNNWVDNTFPGAPNSKLEGYVEGAARLQFLIKPSDDFSALLNVHGRDLDGTARLFRANIFQPGTNDLVDDFERDKISIDGHNEQHLHGYGGSANLTWNLGRTTLHSITGYEHVSVFSRGDIDGGFGASYAPPFGPGFIPFSSESADGLPDHHQFTQEFRLESNEWGRVDWQAGLYYFDEKITVDSFSYDTIFTGGGQNGFAQQRQHDKSWAVFGSVDFDVTDAFKLRAGVRYTDDQKDFTAERFVSPFGLPDTGPLSISPSASKVSWDVSGTWALQDSVNLYARVANGFRAPSIQGRVLFQGPTPSLSVADAETVLSFEAGIKADFMDHRARLSFDVFHYTIDNQQLNAVGGGSNTTTLLNADKSVGQGFEFDAQAYLTDNFLVTLGMSYNDTEIKDRNLAVVPCGSPFLNCTVTDPLIVNDNGTPGNPADDFVEALIDGNPLPQAPKWITNFTARWSIPVGNGEYFVYTDWAYRSKVNFFLYESREFTGKPLLEGGLRVGYNWDYGNNEIALYGRNITNREVAVSGIDFNNLTGMLNEPRIWGIEFSKKF